MSARWRRCRRRRVSVTWQRDMGIVRHFDIKVGETLRIGDDVMVTLQKKSGQLARLTIDRPESIKVEVKGLGAATQAAKGILVAA